VELWKATEAVESALTDAVARNLRVFSIGVPDKDRVGRPP
jgi:hypothetical protein